MHLRTLVALLVNPSESERPHTGAAGFDVDLEKRLPLPRHSVPWFAVMVLTEAQSHRDTHDSPDTVRVLPSFTRAAPEFSMDRGSAVGAVHCLPRRVAAAA